MKYYWMLLLLLIFLSFSTAIATSNDGTPSLLNDLQHTISYVKPEEEQPFAFDAVFGDNMVLQRSPSKAAVYGFLGPNYCQAVQVSLYDTHSLLYTETAVINVTKQPFGPNFGVRPCSEENCPPYGMKTFNPWNEPLPTWKALLRPTPPGGNYTIVAKCTTTEPSSSSQIMITNITFGDVWYCSGQSNMWLPMENSFSRNVTRDAILLDGKYKNLRIMAGSSGNHPYGSGGVWNPGYGAKGGTNPWMTARQAVVDNRLFQFGAACWYFGQRLAELGVNDIPIGLTNTAIGGQRIEEFMNNSTINTCQNRSGVNVMYFDAELFARQVLPFVDMTVKGWVWYQGENNMGGTKGNSAANVGYGCEMRELIQGWRRVWSETPGTTPDNAPFGVVTLASSGSEGGPNMGAMRQAQTANYGVLPVPSLPSTFLAQAYDLDDEWGPAVGPCFEEWSCCDYKHIHFNSTTCNATLAKRCQNACASTYTPDRGGIHPRNKKLVGDRLGTAAFNTVYGGTGPITGPTLLSCSLDENSLWIRFHPELLRSDSLVVNKFPPLYQLPHARGRLAGGSQLWVQTDSDQFCMEPLSYPAPNNSPDEKFETPMEQYCPTWAGGSPTNNSTTTLDGGWIMLNYTLVSSTSIMIQVDLSPLQGKAPTAVRYAWGIIDCCDYSDPDLFVTHGCIANCPIMSTSNLPANPFQAKIDVAGECQCIYPQICSSSSSSSSSQSLQLDNITNTNGDEEIGI
jgi:sialate O-acetylesterase